VPRGGQCDLVRVGPVAPLSVPLEIVGIVQGSCQACVPNPVAASWMARSSTGYSASNQAQAAAYP
jgi:hypothetical protein